MRGGVTAEMLKGFILAMAFDGGLHLSTGRPELAAVEENLDE